MADIRLRLIETAGKTDEQLLTEASLVGSGFIRLSEADKDKQAPEGTLGFIEGVSGKAGIVNRNLRFYSQTAYELGVERAQALIGEGRFLMEVDHPDWRGSLKGAGARITKLWMDGDLMKFEGVILDTPGGQLLKGLLNGGVGVAVSTRGYGSAKYEKMKVDGVETEVAVIQNDFRMEGIDLVLFPSNVFGRVGESEHASNPKKESITVLTLEQLRKEHPELVAAIEAEAREGFISQANHDAAVATARTEGEEAGKVAALESEAVTSLNTVLSAVVEAVTPFVPELKAAAEARADAGKDEENTGLSAAVEALTTQVNALLAEKQELETAKNEAVRKQAVEARTNELLTDSENAELLRPELMACESVEAVNAMFERENARLVALKARLEVKGGEAESGNGKADQETPGSDQAEVDEVRAYEMRLAGTDKLK